MRGPRHTVISPFIALLISSQDATINIESQRWLRPCFSLQVGALAHTPGLGVLYIGGGEGGATGWEKHKGGTCFYN